jgi:hypothetical protein
MYFLDEGNNKIARGEKSPFETTDKYRNLELGEVISIDDPNYLGRIKVRIKGTRSRGGDDGILDENLPWCVPMIPKFFASQPQVSEAVFIFTFGRDRQHADRMYIGPIISQPQQLKFDPFYVTALGGFTFAAEAPKVSVATIPELKGVFPNPEDISIQGRYNTDITQKTNEIILRAGKFETVTPTGNNPFPFKFNAKTQGYIQIKNDTVIKKQTDQQPEEKGTITNIVANKINLLTHKDGAPRFDLTNQDNLISDDEMESILADAHQLPFGDILLQYLRLLKDALFLHVHNGNGNPATDLALSGNKPALSIFKLKADELENQMLSKNIRIN